ncbi:hypothetical protein QAD02_003305 [Eretmocerus hayati]|uniref:Uncharacterized protein n=1 Tax=Eretmocerus hayati TaxID=131215 RepID=A0ACC2NMB7_9HYME|nr:hypothetical protein QAD02_003305 [Eretmocerus hayati]
MTAEFPEESTTFSSSRIDRGGSLINAELRMNASESRCNPENDSVQVFATAKRGNPSSNLGPDVGALENGPIVAKYSENFRNLLDLVLFPPSDLSVEDILNVVQAIYLRHKISKGTRHAILELIKVLAGPEFKNLNLSQYYINEFNQPPEDHKTYTFYCKGCFAVLS